MSKSLTKTINDVSSDLSYDPIDRKDFLAICAKIKIETRSKYYEEKFDKYLEQIEVNECYKEDMSRTADILLSLSGLVTKSYDELIKMIKNYEKNLFNKT